MRTALVCSLLPIWVTMMSAAIACGGGGSENGGGGGGGGNAAGGGGSAGAVGGGTGGGGGGGSSTGGGGGGNGVTNDAGPKTDGGPATCSLALGDWTATLQNGATASGTDLAIIGGSTAISGTIDFTLAAGTDPSTISCSGPATITPAAAPTLVQTLTLPQGTAPCTDPLQLTGQDPNAPLVGLVDYVVTANIDPSTKPPSGTGTFVVKSDGDDGGAFNAEGNITIQHK